MTIYRATQNQWECFYNSLGFTSDQNQPAYIIKQTSYFQQAEGLTFFAWN